MSNQREALLNIKLIAASGHTDRNANRRTDAAFSMIGTINHQEVKDAEIAQHLLDIHHCPGVRLENIERRAAALLAAEVTMNNPYNLPINPETGTIFSRAELREAFEMVEDATNWKNPIDAAIPVYMRDAVEEAVIFYAGCRPTFTPINPKARRSMRRLRVQAVGYYAAVGA